MFSLFKRKKIRISSVSIPDWGWTKTKNEKSIIQWINPEQTIAISINFFELPPDIPTIKNVEALRNFYRHSISNINGGLIEVELSQKGKISFVKTIFKLPQEHSGMTYIASLTLPFETCSFVLKVQAAEIGITGMREALIADRLISANIVFVNEDGYSNWSSDPYDSTFKGATLMNKSEEDRYDIEFPDHPLTQARQILKEVENGLNWSAELETLPQFDK